ncbi:hypothetical protein ACFSYD_03530 [Paracoccus aerius]
MPSVESAGSTKRIGSQVTSSSQTTPPLQPASANSRATAVITVRPAGSTPPIRRRDAGTATARSAARGPGWIIR